MQKDLKIGNESIPYTIKLSRRARRMRISVYPARCQKFSGVRKELAADGAGLNIYVSNASCGVGSEAAVVVTLPWGFKQTYAEKFVEQKRRWILKSLNYFKKFPGRILPKPSRHEYLDRRQEALALAQRKVLQWNQIYGFGHERVSIKNQKTRWGSCSKKGNLNFNYKIVHLPENLVDYLVVHELCHLKEFNHSRNFWALVGRAVPDYKELRRVLRNFGSVSE